MSTIDIMLTSNRGTVFEDDPFSVVGGLGLAIRTEVRTRPIVNRHRAIRAGIGGRRARRCRSYRYFQERTTVTALFAFHHMSTRLAAKATWAKPCSSDGSPVPAARQVLPSYVQKVPLDPPK
jgi:hypothetical protein